MKDIYKDEDFEIPEGVAVSIKSRLVTVKGPRGELTKSLRHIDMEIKKVSERKIKLIVWHGGRKHVACLRTVRSLITNMIQGVTKVCSHILLSLWVHCIVSAFVDIFCSPCLATPAELIPFLPFSLSFRKFSLRTLANPHTGLPLQNALRLRPFPHQRQRHRVPPPTIPL